MMTNYIVRIVFCFLIILFSNTISFASDLLNYKKIVFFGDSLTDNGNLFAADLGFLPKSPPYFYGRFSNGYVWSEHFAKYYYDKNYISSNNYAVGGACALLHDPMAGSLPLTMTASVNAYLFRTTLQNRSETLFIIWIGANDYLLGPMSVEHTTSKVVDNIKKNIERLIYYGGKNFLIINLPDLSKTPYARDNRNAELIQALVINHNTKIKNMVENFKTNNKNIKIELFDVAVLFEKLISHHSDLKLRTAITNTTNACWIGGYTLDGRKKEITENEIYSDLVSYYGHKKNIIHGDNEIIDVKALAHQISISPDLKESYQTNKEAELGLGKPCRNPDDYIFWDRIHPTSLIHKLLSERIIEFVNSNFNQVTINEK